MEHIKRMEDELKDLEEKIEKGKKFLEKEIIEHEFTDEIQRQKLAMQLSYMINYFFILKERIIYDKDKVLV